MAESEPPKNRRRRKKGSSEQEAQVANPPKKPEPPFPPLGRATVAPALQDPNRRAEWDLPTNESTPGPYMVELNLLYKGGVEVAAQKFEEFYSEKIGADAKKRPPVRITQTYYRCQLSVREWRKLVKADEEQAKELRDRLIYRIWPDFPLAPLIDRSVGTIKADAAVRSYEATGDGIVWAVIDSGIAANHIHFGNPDDPKQHLLFHPDVAELHRDFTGDGPSGPETSKSALTDGFGHGTHVAGIIAGGLSKAVKDDAFRVYENVYVSDPSSEQKEHKIQRRTITNPEKLQGVAPRCKLVSLKVLDDNGAGRTSNIMRALEYIRRDLNADPKLLRVHGVNLSLGYEFDAEMFACGQSPLCVEVDRLVKSGVLVVVAAGNTGYGRLSSQQRQTKVGLANTINDPGNSSLAITVGATHRDSPHLYGVSYFSSKGPTGDGRLKPDLVAPGERITSCAAGKKLVSNGGEIEDGVPAYVDDSGTSMAAPHVSGAIAAFLSIRREFIQRPEEVKRIFLESATPLGRERYFEGHGLVDLMRAIQSV